MRDIWDKEEKEKEVRKYSLFTHSKILPPEGEESKLSSSPFAVAREIEKYYFEHLAGKKAFLDAKDEIVNAFVEYEKKLGEAGFSKI